MMNIRVITTQDDLRGLLPDWQALCRDSAIDEFYTTGLWFDALLRCTSTPPDEIRIIVIQDDASLVAVVPFVLRYVDGRFFRMRSLESLGNVYTPYWSASCRDGDEAAAAKALVHFLLDDRDMGWELLRLIDLSSQDPFIRELERELESARIRTIRRDREPNVLVDLGDHATADDYFSSLRKNFRQNIRTSINRMNKDGDFRILSSHSGDIDLDACMDDYYEIYDASWKESEGDSSFHRKLAHIMTGHGMLRLYQLYYRRDDGDDQDRSVPSWDSAPEHYRMDALQGYEPLASQYFIVYGDTAYCLKMSYKSEHAKYGAGTVLFWFSIKHMMEHDEIRCVDFQKGDEEYKLKWGEYNELRYAMVGYRPRRFRPVVEYVLEVYILRYLRSVRDLFRSE